MLVGATIGLALGKRQLFEDVEMLRTLNKAVDTGVSSTIIEAYLPPTTLFRIEADDHSPNPSDPSVTERVITIMLAEEY